MKVIEINCLENGSTGTIMMNIATVARENNIQVETFSGVRKSTAKRQCPAHHHRIASLSDYYMHSVIGKYTGKSNFLFGGSTRKIIEFVSKFNPDVIHLHITHGFYLNNRILFDYLKTCQVPIIWTLHDCWAFTGRCPHFLLSNCDKWKFECNKCEYPQNDYPATFIDNSKKIWHLKKKMFCGVPNLTLVTPSEWLKTVVEKSFLKEYPVRVINNGIDQNVFRPRVSDFRFEKRIPSDKYIVLGVASDWSYRKGLDVFVDLAKKLDIKYQIVLVGTNGVIDKQLPPNIISIPKTHNKEELAEIYTAADVFVNPTREDNFPTVNIESLSCGTPVVTFDTGGSPEIIDHTCGCVVHNEDIDELIKCIHKICEHSPYGTEECLKRASKYKMSICLNQYIDLYKEVQQCDK